MERAPMCAMPPHLRADDRSDGRSLQLELRRLHLPVGEVLGVDAVDRLGAVVVGNRLPQPLVRAPLRHVDKVQLGVARGPHGESVVHHPV
eukprot:4097684-Prymnesium_polylepis.1